MNAITVLLGFRYQTIASLVAATLAAMSGDNINHEFISALSGDEALSKAREHNPGIIILGEDLPILQGPSIVQKLRGEGCESLVILLIGNDMEIFQESFQSDERTIVLPAELTQSDICTKIAPALNIMATF